MGKVSLLRAIAIAVMLSLTACDVPPDPLATQPFDPSITIIPPSPTVAPFAPTPENSDSSNLGVEGFTPAAPPVSGNENATITPTPAATQSSIPMSFVTTDGTMIAGTFYGAPAKPAPTVLLLPMFGAGRQSWAAFAVQLQQAGYNALAVDLRGQGGSGGTVDWTKAPSDTIQVLTRLREITAVDPMRISVVGASVGANLGLVGCVSVTFCKSLVLISPGLDYGGIKTADAIVSYGAKPILIIGSRADKPTGTDSPALDKLAMGDHTLQLFDGTVHGTALFNTQPSLPQQIIQWLGTH
jgi:dienelactone hydrolase